MKLRRRSSGTIHKDRLSVQQVRRQGQENKCVLHPHSRKTATLSVGASRKLLWVFCYALGWSPPFLPSAIPAGSRKYAPTVLKVLRGTQCLALPPSAHFLSPSPIASPRPAPCPLPLSPSPPDRFPCAYRLEGAALEEVFQQLVHHLGLQLQQHLQQIVAARGGRR